MRQLIFRAMHQVDDLVVVFEYCDSKGVTTRRVVSPIRFLGSDRFLGLCLSREEPRQFHLSRCGNLRLDRAESYVMPVAMSN
jgi:predicted DNA-binding transcriptional regulator YafY